MTNTPPAEDQQPEAGGTPQPPPPRYAPPVTPPPVSQPAVGEQHQAAPPPPVSQPVGPPQAPAYTPPPQVATGQNYGHTFASPQPPGQSYQAPQQPGQAYPGQQYPQQQYAGQSYPGQQPPAQPYAGQQHPGQPYAGQPYATGGFGRPGPGGFFDGAAHPDDLTRPLYGANIGQAFIRFFKNYVNFSGRASRSEFWWMALITWGAFIVVGILAGIIEGITASSVPMTSGGGIETLFGLFFLIIFLGTILPWISIGWRRLHDANLAGPLYLLNLVPYVGGLVVFIFTLLPPKPEGRRFDAAPAQYQQY